MVEHLEQNLGNNYQVQEFYSDDSFEAAAELRDNYSRLSSYTHILVAVPTATQQNFRTGQDQPQDRVRVALFIAANDNRDRTRAVNRVEEGMLLSQAYLTDRKWSVSFSHRGFIQSWNKNIELEDDEGVIYSLTGDLNLELDLAEVITQYES